MFHKESLVACANDCDLTTDEGTIQFVINCKNYVISQLFNEDIIKSIKQEVKAEDQLMIIRATFKKLNRAWNEARLEVLDSNKETILVQDGVKALAKLMEVNKQWYE